jgi:hypothetical protein
VAERNCEGKARDQPDERNTHNTISMTVNAPIKNSAKEVITAEPSRSFPDFLERLLGLEPVSGESPLS